MRPKELKKMMKLMMKIDLRPQAKNPISEKDLYKSKHKWVLSIASEVLAHQIQVCGVYCQHAHKDVYEYSKGDACIVDRIRQSHNPTSNNSAYESKHSWEELQVHLPVQVGWCHGLLWLVNVSYSHIAFIFWEQHVCTLVLAFYTVGLNSVWRSLVWGGGLLLWHCWI